MADNWLSTTLQIIPIAIILLVYFVRLEVRLTKIVMDLRWVKQQLQRRAVDSRESEDADVNYSRTKIYD